MNFLFSRKKLQFRALYGVILLLILVPFIVNCNLELAAGPPPEETLVANGESSGEEDLTLALAAFNAANNTLWADASDSIPGVTPVSSSRVSLDVRDANILDVLSVLAIKMGAHVIFLEEPTLVTFKSSNLSAITTFQLLLQKEGLDYLVVHGHYVVGNRDRLYDDFYNRMVLTRYSMQYIAAKTLQDLIAQLDIPVENVTVDVNTQQIWVQGTPMALGKFLELIAAVDRRENAAFDTGGTRIIRMPVSYSHGQNAQAELKALIDLLSILLDGFKDGDAGWFEWDHAGTTSLKLLNWDDPVIRPGEIKMKISPNISTSGDPMHYLIVEGTPDNIETVRAMIEEISSSMGTLPFSFSSPEPEQQEPEQ